MSLFGDEDDSPKKAPTGTLFEESQVKPGGGLFGDDADPWSELLLVLVFNGNLI